MTDKANQSKKRNYLQTQDIMGTFSDKKSFYDYLSEQLYVAVFDLLLFPWFTFLICFFVYQNP